MKNILRFLLRFVIPIFVSLPLTFFVIATKGVDRSIQIGVWVIIFLSLLFMTISIVKKKFPMKYIIFFLGLMLSLYIIYAIHDLNRDKRTKQWISSEHEKFKAEKNIEQNTSIFMKIGQLNDVPNYNDKFIFTSDSIGFDSISMNNEFNSIFVNFKQFKLKKNRQDIEIIGDSIAFFSLNDSILQKQELYNKQGRHLKYIGYNSQAEYHIFEKYQGEIGPEYFCFKKGNSSKVSGLPIIFSKKYNKAGFASIFHEIGDIYLKIQVWDNFDSDPNEILNVDIKTKYSGLDGIPIFIREQQFENNSFTFIIDNVQTKESKKVNIQIN